MLAFILGGVSFSNGSADNATIAASNVTNPRVATVNFSNKTTAIATHLVQMELSKSHLAASFTNNSGSKAMPEQVFTQEAPALKRSEDIICYLKAGGFCDTLCSAAEDYRDCLDTSACEVASTSEVQANCYDTQACRPCR